MGTQRNVYISDDEQVQERLRRLSEKRQNEREARQVKLDRDRKKHARRISKKERQYT